MPDEQAFGDRTKSIREYAHYLGVAPAKVREWIRKGQLAAIDVGGRRSSLRITPQAAADFEESRRVKPVVKLPPKRAVPMSPRVAALMGLEE
jgi:excisionase family DNA binding protein